MRLLLLACLRAQTGNATTAARIQNHLHAAGHICVLKDALMYESPAEIANLTSTDKFDAALAIHLYKAGRLLQGSRIPFGIIFGGTDVNEDIKCKEKHRVMGAVLEEARFAVAFTMKMKELAAAEWVCLHDDGDAYSIIKKSHGRQMVTQRVAACKDCAYLRNETGTKKEAKYSLKIAKTGALKKPDARKKIYVQTQGIKTTPSETFDWYRFLQNADIPTETDSLHVFLLICGLRRVKDPLYLVNVFSDWHRKDPSVHLGIIGPAVFFKRNQLCYVYIHSSRSLEKEACSLNLTSGKVMRRQLCPMKQTLADTKKVDPLFASEIKEKVKRAPGVHLLQEIPQDDLHAVMKRCFAVVNSSISEGMSAAILEAMDLDIPVLARNIPGNAAIIKHKETGLLFSDPQEFVVLSKSLMNDPIMEREIVTRAKDYVKKHHSWESERKAYQDLVLRLQ